MDAWDEGPPFMFGQQSAPRLQVSRNVSVYEASNDTVPVSLSDLPNEFHGVNCVTCGHNLMPCKSHSSYQWTNSCNFGVPVVRFANFSGYYYRIKVNEAPGYEYLNEEAEKALEKYPRNSPDGELRYYLCHDCMVSKKYEKRNTPQTALSEDKGLTIRQEFKIPSLHTPITLEELAFEAVWRFILKNLNVASHFKKVCDKTIPGYDLIMTPSEIKAELCDWIDSVIQGTMKTRMCELALARILESDAKMVTRVKGDLYQMFLSPESEKVSLCCSRLLNKASLLPEMSALMKMKCLTELKLLFRVDAALSNENMAAFKHLQTLKTMDIEFRTNEWDALHFFQTISSLTLSKLRISTSGDNVYEFCLISMVHQSPAKLPRAKSSLLEKVHCDQLTTLAKTLEDVQLNFRIGDMTLHGLAYLYLGLEKCQSLKLLDAPPAAMKVAIKLIDPQAKTRLMLKEFSEPSFTLHTLELLSSSLPNVERLKLFSFGNNVHLKDHAAVHQIRSLFVGEVDIGKFEAFFMENGEDFWKIFPNVKEVCCPGILLSCEQFTKGLHNLESLELLPPGVPATFRKKLPLELKNLKRLYSWCCLDKHLMDLLKNNQLLSNVLVSCIHGLKKLPDIMKYLSKTVTQLQLLEQRLEISIDDFIAIARYYPDLKYAVFGTRVTDKASDIPLKVQELKEIFVERQGQVACAHPPRFCKCSLAPEEWRSEVPENEQMEDEVDSLAETSGEQDTTPESEASFSQSRKNWRITQESFPDRQSLPWLLREAYTRAGVTCIGRDQTALEVDRLTSSFPHPSVYCGFPSGSRNRARPDPACSHWLKITKVTACDTLRWLPTAYDCQGRTLL